MLVLYNNISAMSRKSIIERTLKTIQRLPEDKAMEVADFADFIFKRHEEQLMQNGIEKIVSESETFNFFKWRREPLFNSRHKRKIVMAKGEIILIPFPFSDLSGNKLRPAVILAERR